MTGRLRSNNFWKQVLKDEKILNDKEAGELFRYIKILREESGFRR